MDRTQVATFYRGKGYLVHESIVVTGQSGNQQRIPLLCEGPLGNLAVFFGDAAGIDGPEIGAAKRVAKDLGATAVVAAGTFTADQRRTAAELGVVLLDATAIESPLPAAVPSAWPGQTPGAALERDLNAHPWPASGRPGGVDGPAHNVAYDVDELLDRFERAKQPVPGLAATKARPTTPEPAGLWKQPRAHVPSEPRPGPAPRAAPATSESFAWLSLPKPEPATAEIEYNGTLAARAAVPASLPPTAQETAQRREERLLAEAALRMWVRRGAWTLGGAVLAYLFLLWWF
jgi:hypothetical protein